MAATVGLTVLKLAAGFATGSVGVFSEAIHSFLDLISAAVSFFTVREAGKPADEDHPFGHGKIETLSSLLEAVLLVAAAALISREAIEHILHPHPVQYQGMAIAVIAVSLVVSWVVYRHNRGAAEATESSALHVNALHFLSDVLASAAVLIGLIVLKFTGWLVVDGVMALIVALYIFYVSLLQVRHALRELTDSQLPDGEISAIRRTIDGFKDRMIDAHDLRTRKSGATRHIDFHMTVCGHMSVHESHEVCDQMEHRLLGDFPGASVQIHVEPCAHVSDDCHKSCLIYQRWVAAGGSGKRGG